MAREININTAEVRKLTAENARLLSEHTKAAQIIQGWEAESAKLRSLLDVIVDAEPEWRESAVWREALGA